MSFRTLLASALLLCATGCSTTVIEASEAPAARAPVLASVSAIAGRSCAWSAVRANKAGRFELLPSGHPSGDFRVVFTAPYPSRIEVDIAGRFVLPNAANATDRSKGYYRVDSVEEASSGDSFVWNVTVTPPVAARLLPAFDLNIRSLSINPSHSGADKTSAPLTLYVARRPVADVQAWLDQHVAVREALRWDGWTYWHWSATDKQVFRDAFELAWNGSALPLPDALPTWAPAGSADPPITVLASGHAKALFFAYAAAGLAAEIAGWTSWSITDYAPEQLELLFDSRALFRWNPRFHGFEVVQEAAKQAALPESPREALELMYDRGLFTCESRRAVIARTLEWAQQSQGDGTNGCARPIGSVRAALRLANIPVRLETEARAPGASNVPSVWFGGALSRDYKVEALEGKAQWSRIDEKLDGRSGGCAVLSKK